jgi:hypothetical protein
MDFLDFIYILSCMHLRNYSALYTALLSITICKLLLNMEIYLKFDVGAPCFLKAD